MSAETPEWMESLGDSLSEELRGNETLRQTPDVATLAQRFVDAKAYQGNSIRIPSAEASAEDRATFTRDLAAKASHLKLVSIPGEDATDEERREYLSSLGVPKTTEGYKFEGLQVPDGVKLTDLDNYRERVLKLGLTDAQAKGILELDIERAQAQGKTNSEQLEAGAAVLKRAWGDNYDALEKAALEGAMHLAEAAGEGLGAELRKLVENDTFAKQNPVLMQALSAYGVKLIESGDGQQGGTGVTNFITPDEAKKRISEMRNNPEHPLNQARHPDHKEAVEELQRLTRIKLGEAAAAEKVSQPLIVDESAKQTA